VDHGCSIETAENIKGKKNSENSMFTGTFAKCSQDQFCPQNKQSTARYVLQAKFIKNFAKQVGLLDYII